MLLSTGISLLLRSRELHFQVRSFVDEMQKWLKICFAHLLFHSRKDIIQWCNSYLMP